VGSAKPSRDASRRTEAAPFLPVPNPKGFARSAAKPSSQASRRTEGAPVPSSKGVAGSAASASGEVKRLAQSVAAPLLRAFDHGKPGASRWSTVKTVVAPRPPVEEAEGAANEPVAPVERGQPTSARLPARQRIHRAPRQPSAATQRISALVVAAALVVCSGTFLARNMVAEPDPGSVSAAAALPVPTEAQAEPLPALEAPTDPANSELIPPSPALAQPTARQPSTTLTHASKQAHGAAATPPDSSASGQVTLARQAVDALLAGDRPRALLHYKDLTRTAPDREVYREAVRLLAPAASDTPQ
jgi:hypothetical protein